MAWTEVFVVLLVLHLIGDFLLQTDWQATHKRGGLTGTPESRRALLSHVATYMLAILPALVWLADDLGASALGIAALIAVPHVVQDDGRLVAAYAHRVKKVEPSSGQLLMAVDQTFHIVALFLVALLAG